MDRDERIFLGLYSGPSADGIDAAIVSIRGVGAAMAVEQISHVSRMLPDSERRQILALAGGRQAPARAWAELARSHALAAATAGEIARQEASLPWEDICAVGYSGQEIDCARPAANHGIPADLTLDAPAVLAEKTRCTVVSNFSAADLAVGGVGGPITAWCDWLLLRHPRQSRVVVQLGGLANFTFLPADPDPLDVLAGDIGPGTILVDELIHRYHHQAFDVDGGIAASGRIDAALLNELGSHAFFQARPPKRARLCDWIGEYTWRLERIAERHDCHGANLIATVTELTARQVAESILNLTERPHEVILTGGGAMNIHLAGRLRKLLSPSSTFTIERFGLGLRAKQAVCMAILAAARMDDLAAHCPAATGADRCVRLGQITSL